jgi:protein-disulfide isomerase
MRQQKELPPIIAPRDVTLGLPNAPVRVVLFGDYESEDSGSVNDMILELVEQYKEEMSYTFRHFPLTRVHQKAHKAAEAAIGAAQEGKFWELHQILFQNRRNLGLISLKSYAREAGVMDKKFLDHLINSTYGWFVQDDLKEGIKLEVTSVPALFINGERWEKEPTMKSLKLHIDGLLKQKKTAPMKLKAARRA